MEPMDRIMHRMELLLVEAQDAILNYDSKTINNSNDSLSSVDTLEETKSPFEVLTLSVFLGWELQYAFFQLVFATWMFLFIKFGEIFLNEFNIRFLRKR